MFDYAAGTPLNLVTHDSVAGVTVDEISYDNGAGGRCIATLVTPRQPTGTGVVIAHGGSGDGRRFFMTEALALAGRGMTVLLPVTELPAHGDIEASRQAIRRHVLSHRRGVDVLETVTEGRGLVHFYGHSGGAAQGAMLSAVEPRIAAFAITSIGAGTITRIAATELPPGTEATDRYLRFLEQFEPQAWVATPGPRRLLFQHGRRDPVVRRDESLKLFEAAAGPKEWHEYDCGHDPDGDPKAVADRAELFSMTPPRSG
jgi:pimeloyl-ACP methyl ester carboxylesterase